MAGARRFEWAIEAPVVAIDPETGLAAAYGEFDQRALEQAAIDGVAIVRRLGGAMLTGAQRVEVRDEVFETAAIVWEWKSFAPAVRRPRPEETDEPPARPEPGELSEDEIAAHFPEPEPAEVP